MITARYVAYTVDALVGTEYVGGYQVYVARLEVHNATDVACSRERLPPGRGLSTAEAAALLASTIALLKAEGRVVL